MYKIIGADQKEYGPVSIEQLRLWITEGRVDGAIGKAQAFVGNDKIQVEVNRVAKALAARTSSEGIVEAEEARLRLAAGTMAALALIRAGEAMALALSQIPCHRCPHRGAQERALKLTTPVGESERPMDFVYAFKYALLTA